MPNAKPTTLWLDDEDRELAEQRKRENGIRSTSALFRFWLRYPPKKR